VRKAKNNERESASRGAYATPADFKQVFSEEVSSLYLLSLLLTGSHERAEACFVEGIGQSTKGNHVFKEWARSWARRTIIQSAIQLAAPMDYAPAVTGNADVARGMDKFPPILHAEIRAILKLAPLERFVFVMSALEHYSDNDCSLLLGRARRDIATIRARAMQQLGSSAVESSLNTARCETTAKIITPLLAQYFAPSTRVATISQ
jgi:DNA-directed RNA polymerase specialized sigma24 family protein